MRRRPRPLAAGDSAPPPRATGREDPPDRRCRSGGLASGTDPRTSRGGTTGNARGLHPGPPTRGRIMLAVASPPRILRRGLRTRVAPARAAWRTVEDRLPTTLVGSGGEDTSARGWFRREAHESRRVSSSTAGLQPPERGTRQTYRAALSHHGCRPRAAARHLFCCQPTAGHLPAPLNSESFSSV